MMEGIRFFNPSFGIDSLTRVSPYNFYQGEESRELFRYDSESKTFKKHK